MQNINLNNTNIAPAESLPFYFHTKWHQTYSSFSTAEKIAAYPANLLICAAGVGLTLLASYIDLPLLFISLAVYGVAKGINLFCGTNVADSVKNFSMKYGIKGIGYTWLAVGCFLWDVIIPPGVFWNQNQQNQPLQPQYHPLLINGAPNLTKAAECA